MAASGHLENTFQYGFRGHFFRIFEINSFCFVVALFYLLHAVDAINDLR